MSDDGQRHIGGYAVEELVGRGGMGEVWAAFDPTLRRRVALKVLDQTAALDPRIRTRFLREGRALAALSHPNIVTVLAAGEENGVAFIAMELLDGETLRRAIARGAPLASRLRWLVEIARALETVHAAGLVHRDVKPDNAFVTRHGVKLLDLGIARDAAGAIAMPTGTPLVHVHTATGTILGTARYMAPEQWRGSAVDARSDQYSFGVVAYEALSLRHPDATTPGFGAAHDDARDPTPLATIAPELPFGISSVVAKMLHRAPAERFASMTDVREALEALADRVQKPPAPPPGSARHLRTFAAGALLVPLTALSVAGGMVIYRTTRSPVPAVPAPSMTALVASERVDAAAFGASTDPDLDAARLPEAAPPPRSILNSSWVDIDVEPLRSWFDEERSRAWKKAVQPALIRCLNSRPVPLSCPPDGGTLSLTISPQGRVVRASMSTRGLRAGLDGPFCTLPEWTPCTTAAARTMDLTPSAKRGADMDVSLGLYFDATRNRAPH